MIAVLESDGVTVDLVRDDGSLLGTHKFAGNDTYSAFTATAGRFWYIGASDHHLHTLAPDGTDTDIAPLADIGGTNYVNGLAVSLDGQQWAWGVFENSSSGTSHTRIDVGGVGVPTRMALEQPTQNPVLTPLDWDAHGIVVSRNRTGIGGCCYLTPETAGIDVMVVDPASLLVTRSWTGCATASVSSQGSFACVTGAGGTGPLVVHEQSGTDVTMNPQPPVVRVGWVFVDDSANRVLFAVIHSYGAGGGDGPYVIDTESGDLGTRTVVKLYDQATPDAILPDGRLVVSAAPPSPSSTSGFSVSIRSNSGSSTHIGPSGSQYLASFSLLG